MQLNLNETANRIHRISTSSEVKFSAVYLFCFGFTRAVFNIIMWHVNSNSKVIDLTHVIGYLLYVTETEYSNIIAKFLEVNGICIRYIV